MQELIGLSFSNLQQLLADMGEKPFRAKQLWQWIYNKGVTDFSQMTTLSKPFREKLSGLFTVSHPKIVTEQNSTDKTRKWLMAFADGQQVECVYIPESEPGRGLHFHSGRLCPRMQILSHRHTENDAQPDGR